MLNDNEKSLNEKGLMVYNKFAYLSAKDLFLHSKFSWIKFGLLIALLYLVFCNAGYFAITLIISINVFFFITFFVKVLFFVVGIFSKAGHVPEKDYMSLDESTLPIYTVLLPLYREASVLPKLLHGIYNLNYPMEKLDVKVVLDEDDKETIEKAHEMIDNYGFDLIVVPNAKPHTKPRACTYALNFAKGKYVTIYDAEDTPEKYQLKKAVYQFRKLDESVICLQARLNYFNRDESVLTRMFAIEYASWFNFMIKGLKHFNVPIPLGGTSNHFKTENLVEIGGWDAYNVTEDADLGVRIERLGYKVDLIDSLTEEEAPLTIVPWIKQRTRWIKGFMQTYFVHMRSPRLLLKQLGLWKFLGFQVFIGAPSIVFLMTPVLVLLSLLRVLGVVDIPGATDYNFLLKFNFYSTFITMLVCAVYIVTKYEWSGMLKYCFLFPFYWILHTIASFRALWQLIKKPYYWDKTDHGITEFKFNGIKSKYVVKRKSCAGDKEDIK